VVAPARDAEVSRTACRRLPPPIRDRTVAPVTQPAQNQNPPAVHQAIFDSSHGTGHSPTPTPLIRCRPPDRDITAVIDDSQPGTHPPNLTKPVHNSLIQLTEVDHRVALTPVSGTPQARPGARQKYSGGPAR
jgi:hypothetical protein